MLADDAGFCVVKVKQKQINSELLRCQSSILEINNESSSAGRKTFKHAWKKNRERYAIACQMVENTIKKQNQKASTRDRIGDLLQFRINPKQESYH